MTNNGLSQEKYLYLQEYVQTQIIGNQEREQFFQEFSRNHSSRECAQEFISTMVEDGYDRFTVDQIYQAVLKFIELHPERFNCPTVEEYYKVLQQHGVSGQDAIW